MLKIEDAYEMLLEALRRKQKVLLDKFDIVAREGDEELTEQLSERIIQINAALISLDDVGKARWSL